MSSKAFYIYRRIIINLKAIFSNENKKYSEKSNDLDLLLKNPEDFGRNFNLVELPHILKNTIEEIDQSRFRLNLVYIWLRKFIINEIKYLNQSIKSDLQKDFIEYCEDLSKIFLSFHESEAKKNSISSAF